MKTIDMYKKEILEKYNNEYIILSDEYKGDKVKLLTLHSLCNEKFEISPNRLLSGNGCKKCAYRRKSEEMKLKNSERKDQFKTKTPEEYRKEFYSKFNSLELLNDYINSKTKVKVKCNNCNHIWDVIPNKILNAKNSCPNCYQIKRKKHNQSPEALEDYLNSLSDKDKFKVENFHDDKIKIKHINCNNSWDTTIYELNSSPSINCKYCSRSNTFNLLHNINTKYLVKGFLMAKRVKFIEDFIENNYKIDFKIGNVLIKIIDIHNDNTKYIDKVFIYKLYKYFKTQNYRLLLIYSDELENKTEITLTKLSHILNLNKDLNKIYARNCYIKEIGSLEKNKFLNKNHIQGSDACNIALGLFYKNELVSIMTFIKPRKALGRNSNDEYDYELSRFASNNDYIVVGSFSKLFSYFKNNYKWRKIITYADLRYSEGNVYLKNGFSYLYNSKPSYYYIDLDNIKQKREFRYKYRKQILKDLFPESYDDSKTEKEIMEENNFYQIYNLGNMVFEYSKN